ncbi:hypothetical protein [Qipengyuania sp.]|uniref:hypothetical protein n=1 Tax=Qipengyuania sp. TaxID=2004515 RepID=UPI0035C79AB5
MSGESKLAEAIRAVGDAGVPVVQKFAKDVKAVFPGSSDPVEGPQARPGARSAARREDIVTWDQAEEALGEAVEMLGVLPDKERGFLMAGRKSSMPQVLRIEQSDYPDRPDPRRRLSARDMARVDAMLLGEDALAMAIPEQHRALVGRVIVMKRWPERTGGFRWADVRADLQRRFPGERVPDGDALRMRYERAIAKLAKAMTVAVRGRAA